MNELEFHTKVDTLFLAIEHWVEDNTNEIDFETSEGILTLFLPKPKEGELILSRQANLRELWLASPAGAYHFVYQKDQWITRQGQPLLEILSDLLQQCAGVSLSRSFS